LRDIPAELDKMRNAKLVLALKQRDLTLLTLMLPGALQPPVDKMRTALSQLLHKNTEAFKTQYAEAEAEFYQALDKRQKIEAFTRKVERDIVPPSYLYAAQLMEIEKYSKTKSSLWPELHSYMDMMEKGDAR
jgi:hypothetical protein